MSLKYWALLILLALGWGSSFFFNEILLRELGPLTVALGRVGFGALGCWAWLICLRRPMAIPSAALLSLIVFGIIQYAVPLAVYPLAQQYITSSAAGIVNAMTPVFTVVITHYWPRGETLTVSKLIGVVTGFVGIVILAVPSMRGQGDSNIYALIFAMISPICYAIVVNYVRRLDGMDRVVLTAWSLTFGTLALAPLALGLEGVPHIERAETWGALLVISLVLTAAAFILLFWLIPRIGPTRTTLITFIAPVSAVLLGVYVLGENLLPLHYLGIGVIFIGLLFVDERILKRSA